MRPSYRGWGILGVGAITGGQAGARGGTIQGPPRVTLTTGCDARSYRLYRPRGTDGRADDFRRQLNKFADRVKRAVPPGGQVSITEILTPAFMAQHTQFPTFEAMCEAVGIMTAEDFTAFPDVEWEAHVRTTTRFSSWKAMKEKGGQLYFKRRIEGR